MRRRGFAMAVGVQDPPALHRSETCFGKPVGRGRLSQKLWPSPGKLFREARRASPQRQNNGAHACDGAGLPWLSRKLRPSPGKLFREARRASPQRRNNGARVCDGAGLPWLSASKIPPLCIARKLVSGSPSGQPPAPKRRKRARGRLSQKLWPSPGTSAVARKVVSRSPTGQLPASKLRERARATLEEAHFSMFLLFFLAVPLNTKNGEEGHPPPFFLVLGRIQKRCHAASKMKKRDTGPLFSFFGRTQKRCH